MTNAELAILSLIVQQPRHGYEIEGVIEERGMRNWTEVGFSSIYYVLNKLEKQGLVAGQLMQQPGRGPARKVYAVTQAGRDAWQQATLDALSQTERCYPQLLLGLANLGDIPTDLALAALGQYRRKLAARRDHLLARQPDADGSLPYYVMAMFDYSHVMLDAELAWVTRFIHQLTALDSAAESSAAKSGG